MLFKSLAATTLLAVSAVSAADLPTIDVVGNKFFYSNNGSQFYIKGVAYQEDVSNSTDSSFTDPLLDASTCKRDIPYLQELGTNVVRVYAVNASLNHDDCMQALNDAGIYVILDLAEPTDAIDTTDPSWTVGLYNRYTEVIDMFQDYPNVLGFFAGNEVVTNTSTSNAAPYVKALIRDMKQYMSDQGYRLIPIGYSANDESKTRVFSADYFACGDDDVSADFYGINMYEWCGSSSFTASGYKARTEEFSNLSVPVFFSEYGCNAVQPRKFTEVATLYSDEMTDVWSGGIVYMYFETANDYGLVSIDGDSVKTLSDFNYLKSQLASISPSSASSALVSATATTMSCPATNAAWEAATSLPPTPDQDLCDCAELAFGCVVDSSVDSDDYADLFSYVCNEIDCSEINGNGTTGEYGDYSFCSSKVKLNYVLNKYYEKEDSSKSACDFDGSATINKKATTAASCSSILKGASASGSTTKHHKTTATTSGSDSSATGSSSDASSSGSKSGSDSSSAASSSAKSGASSLYSRKYTSSFSELTMTVLFSTTVMVGAVVLAL